jgi:thioredoxin 1
LYRGGGQLAAIDVDASNWNDEVMKHEDLIVVDFWHDKCPFCKRLEPIFHELSSEYEGRVKFAKFNVLESAENKAIAVKHGLMGTPTLVFFCSGKAISTHTGFMPRDRLRATLDDMLGKYKDCVEQTTDINYI